MPDDTVPSGTFGDYGALITNTTAKPNVRRDEVCQASGFRVPRNELARNWDGTLVKVRYRDHRHPQEFQRSVPQQAKRQARAEHPDVFIGSGDLLVTENSEPFRVDQHDSDTHIVTGALREVHVEDL